MEPSAEIFSNVEVLSKGCSRSRWPGSFRPIATQYRSRGWIAVFWFEFGLDHLGLRIRVLTRFLRWLVFPQSLTRNSINGYKALRAFV